MDIENNELQCRCTEKRITELKPDNKW